MKHWVETFDYQPNYNEFSFFTEETIGYDIETTGLSSKRHQIYLIGCCIRRGNKITLHQFFAESPSDESNIITAFFDLSKDFSRQMTFNGIRFDEPFIRERAKHLHISDDYFPDNHFDIFKQCTPLKKLLGLTSCRQKSIEDFLGIKRIDIYSGGELIPIYKSYLEHSTPEQMELLKQHNYDDVKGMLSLLPILTYYQIFNISLNKISIKENIYSDYNKNTQLELEIWGELPQKFPSDFRLNSSFGYYIFEQNFVHGMVPLYHGTLRYYFSDYKNYVYLPAENTLLLKELADYIPKDQKRKATPDECFSDKNDDYLQIPDNLPLGEGIHRFKKNRKDKEVYISIHELKLLENQEAGQSFINTLLHAILLAYKKDTDK